jgi:thioredoxin reductase
MIVGGGNSAAQILAEVSKVADAIWVTKEEPTFLHDDVDGRVLFHVATQRYQAQQEGKSAPSLPTLGDIVMIDSVKEARTRGVLKSVRPFKRFAGKGVVWNDDSETEFHSVIWCTGFRPALGHLKHLGIMNNKGRIEVKGTKALSTPGLWLVGYGEWTGFGSATLIGVQRYARSTATEIQEYLNIRPRKSE